MKKLTSKQVLEIHADLIFATGGTDGLRDMGMLESALNSPFQTYDKVDMYPTLQQKAPVWLFQLLRTILLLMEIKDLAYMSCSYF
jgi:death-on-curing protein